MKYRLQSSKYLKRNRWFTNDDYGISLEYWWQDHVSSITFDTSLIEKDREAECLELLELTEKISNEKCENSAVEIDYPAPSYFIDIKDTISWDIPQFKKIGPNFKLVMSSNYVYEKAVALQKVNKLNKWGSVDKAFAWEIENERPAIHQEDIEYQSIERVWNSETWLSDAMLDKFMRTEFGMEIEDDYFSFYLPTLFKVD